MILRLLKVELLEIESRVLNARFQCTTMQGLQYKAKHADIIEINLRGVAPALIYLYSRTNEKGKRKCYLIKYILEQMRPQVIGNFTANMAIKYGKQTELILVHLLKLCKNIVFHVMI